MKRVNDLLLDDFQLSSQQEGAHPKLPSPTTEKVLDSLPNLPPSLVYVVSEVQKELGYMASRGEDVDFSSSDIRLLISTVAERLGLELMPLELDEIQAHIESSQKIFGPLQKLVDDPSTSDIIVFSYNRVDIQRDRKNITTNISFPSQKAYEAFVEKLLQKAGTTYSTAKPIADGMIGSYARIHAVHKCICDEGPYLTIRLNRFSSVSISDLMRFQLAPKAILDYLQSLVKSGQTVLVVGEVGTGKTTLLRALASSIADYESILVIEDTPEIMLNHPHCRYIYTREANTDGAGRVPPAECIRAGMRMAMNRIVFGEMRDAEAAEAFIDVCASGHPGLSTIHARNASEAISRLELFLGRAQKGVSRSIIYEQISKSVQVIVFLNICHDTGKRRIMEVLELGSVSENTIRRNPVFVYQCKNGDPKWSVRSKISFYKEALEKHGFYLHSLPNTLIAED